MTAAALQARYVTCAARNTKPGPVLLADYLAGFRARKQGAWPSQRAMARRFSVNVRTIRRWTEQLTAAGLLHVERSKPRHDHITGRWRRRTNRYRCTFGKKKRGQIDGKAQVAPSGHFCPQKGLYEEPCNGSAPESVVSSPLKPPEPVAPPPWQATGMTATQWTRELQKRTER